VRVAVVDLGTNSTRLLVADVRDEDGHLAVVGRRSTVTRLGDGVDSSGQLDDEAMERVFETLGDYRALIDAGEADEVVAVATSAVRDAENGEQFREELRRRFDIDARIIPGEEEARLTFLGATATREERGTDLMVMDIGGGSTEFVVGTPGSDPRFHASTTLGSVRHTERHLEHDPPEAGEVDALSRDARDIIESECPRTCGARPAPGSRWPAPPRSSPRSTWRAAAGEAAGAPTSTATGSGSRPAASCFSSCAHCRSSSAAKPRGWTPTALRRSSPAPPSSCRESRHSGCPPSR
jgi:hypothetical protein